MVRFLGVGQIDISRKRVIYREAVAEGIIHLKQETLKIIKENKVEKGNTFQIAGVAAIQGAKMTSQLIPFCHNIPIEKVDIGFKTIGRGIVAKARVVSIAKTGVEMEAITCVLTALLNIWDVVKRYEKDENGQYPQTKITNIRIVKKVKKDGRCSKT